MGEHNYDIFGLDKRYIQSIIERDDKLIIKYQYPLWYLTQKGIPDMSDRFENPRCCYFVNGSNFYGIFREYKVISGGTGAQITIILERDVY